MYTVCEHTRKGWHPVGTFPTFRQALGVGEGLICPDLYHNGNIVTGYYFSDEHDAGAPYKACIRVANRWNDER